MIVRILTYAALFYLAFRVVRSLTGVTTNRIDPGAGKSAPQIDDIMIKDPVCNIYFPKREGIHLRKNGKDLYFCSKKCRDEYLNTHK